MISIEFKYNLNTKVKILINGLAGTIVGLYLDKYGNKEANVEYVDKNGLIVRRWIREEKLELE